MRMPAERSRFKMWANYFGGGMSSVLFQDIREFRALAYSAQGRTWLTDLKLNPDSPCAFVTSLGTQSDKSMRALGVLDSIFTDMPLRPANVDATRQRSYDISMTSCRLCHSQRVRKPDNYLWWYWFERLYFL